MLSESKSKTNAMLKSIATCQRRRHVIDITEIVCITKEEEKEHNLTQTNKHSLPVGANVICHRRPLLQGQELGTNC